MGICLLKEWSLTPLPSCPQVYGLPVDRVWVSVYEEDDEALAIWRDEIGVPVERIKRMGAADNFWASGPTGEMKSDMKTGVTSAVLLIV